METALRVRVGAYAAPASAPAPPSLPARPKKHDLFELGRERREAHLWLRRLWLLGLCRGNEMPGWSSLQLSRFHRTLCSAPPAYCDALSGRSGAAPT